MELSINLYFIADVQPNDKTAFLARFGILIPVRISTFEPKLSTDIVANQRRKNSGWFKKSSSDRFLRRASLSQNTITKETKGRWYWSLWHRWKIRNFLDTTPNANGQRSWSYKGTYWWAKSLTQKSTLSNKKLFTSIQALLHFLPCQTFWWKVF